MISTDNVILQLGRQGMPITSSEQEDNHGEG